jgi:hypothetical protein
VRLFFGDSFEVANQRLKSGAWDVHNRDSLPTQRPDMTGWTPEEQAEWCVTGKQPERLTKKRRKGGAA